MWITNYIDRIPYLSSEEVIADYKANPANYYGMLIGIDEDGFDILTAGSAITYICFQSMNYMEIPFQVLVRPLIIAMILVILICTIAPLLSYKKLAGNRFIVERLRDYE